MATCTGCTFIFGEEERFKFKLEESVTVCFNQPSLPENRWRVRIICPPMWVSLEMLTLTVFRLRDRELGGSLDGLQLPKNAQRIKTLDEGSEYYETLPEQSISLELKINEAGIKHHFDVLIDLRVEFKRGRASAKLSNLLLGQHVAASIVTQAKVWWNHNDELQAYARCHRSGQKKEVRVFQLMASDSMIDLALHNTNRKKMEVNKVIMGQLRRLDGTRFEVPEIPKGHRGILMDMLQLPFVVIRSRKYLSLHFVML